MNCDQMALKEVTLPNGVSSQIIGTIEIHAAVTVDLRHPPARKEVEAHLETLIRRHIYGDISTAVHQMRNLVLDRPDRSSAALLKELDALQALVDSKLDYGAKSENVRPQS